MGLEEMRKGRAQQVLDQMIKVDGRTMPRREFLHMLAEHGGQLSSLGIRIQGRLYPDDVDNPPPRFYPLIKTEREYLDTIVRGSR